MTRLVKTAAKRNHCRTFKVVCHEVVMPSAAATTEVHFQSHGCNCCYIVLIQVSDIGIGIDLIFFLLLQHFFGSICQYFFILIEGPDPVCLPFSSLSLPGGGTSSISDFSQSDIQFFPGHAAMLFSVCGSLVGLFPSTSGHPAESVHTSAHSDSCSRSAGVCGSAVFYMVRY